MSHIALLGTRGPPASELDMPQTIHYSTRQLREKTL